MNALVRYLASNHPGRWLAILGNLDQLFLEDHVPVEAAALDERPKVQEVRAVLDRAVDLRDDRSRGSTVLMGRRGSASSGCGGAKTMLRLG
jgi:hypothetical protein